MTAFTQLALPAALLEAVELAGLTDMTPVQEQALPPILENRDVLALAPTGSGKTAAFGLGLLQSIDPSLIRVQALVLCPTRELADQVGHQHDQEQRNGEGQPLHPALDAVLRGPAEELHRAEDLEQEWPAGRPQVGDGDVPGEER